MEEQSFSSSFKKNGLDVGMSKQTELTVLGNTRGDHSDQKHQQKLSDIDK